MKHFSLILLLIAISVSGCTFYHVNAEEIVSALAAPKNDPKRIPYIERIDAPHDVIGTVSVVTERRNSLDEVVEKMQRQIAIMGGDAVTNIIQSDEPGPIIRIRTKYTGTVVVFQENNLK